MPPRPVKIFEFLTFWDYFRCNLGVKVQKLDDLMLNLVVVFEPHRIKGVTLLWATEAAKQLAIHIRHGEISACTLIAYRNT